LGAFGWLGRWSASGAGAKALAAFAAAAVVGAFLLALAMLARHDDASLGKLVWVRDGDLWVRTLPDGEPRRLTSDGGNSLPRWSPSGEWVLYRHGQLGVDAESRVMRADGSEDRRLDVSEGFYAGQWKPGEDRLLLVRPDGAVVVEDVATGSALTILEAFASTTEGRAVLPVWSLDGARVVFFELRWPAEAGSRGLPARAKTYSGLSVIDSDGTNRRELVNLGANPTKQIGPLGFAGERLLFMEMPEDAGESIFDGVELLSVSLSGGAVQDLGGRVTLLSGMANLFGERAFVVLGDERESWTGKRIALVDATTGQVRSLTGTDVAALSPQVSADGARVAYVAAPDLGAGVRDRALASRRIWVMDADGSNARQVSRDEEYRHEAPRWSNDGKYMLFARLTLERCSPSWTLQLLDVRDGSIREVASELPAISTHNERPVIDQIPECDPGGKPGSISDTYGSVGVTQAYDWWQPAG
ncbi:MAG TPA: hypothetical protein PLX85_06465, partial [Dehalococcoidia bacterium]|nr:hypothetical protein [Dehalococcoidia bacterium]